MTIILFSVGDSWQIDVSTISKNKVHGLRYDISMLVPDSDPKKRFISSNDIQSLFGNNNNNNINYNRIQPANYQDEDINYDDDGYFLDNENIYEDITASIETVEQTTTKQNEERSAEYSDRPSQVTY